MAKQVCSIGTLATYLGEATAIKLIKHFGGTEEYVPISKEGGQYLKFKAVLTESEIDNLFSIYSGESIYIPKNDNDHIMAVRAEMIERHARGESTKEIAKNVKKPSTNYSARWVRKIVSEHNQTQIPLFSD